MPDYMAGFILMNITLLVRSEYKIGNYFFKFLCSLYMKSQQVRFSKTTEGFHRWYWLLKILGLKDI